MPATVMPRKFPARRRVKKAAARVVAPAIVNVHEAKTQLSRLLARVATGEEITIARGGEPLARLVPLQVRGPRVPGRYKGMFGPLTAEEAMAPLPPECAGVFPSKSDPLAQS